MGAIYKITNSLNNKSYIGQTRVGNPFSRLVDHYRGYKEHKKYSIYSAMNKYGISNFTFTILEDEIDNEELNNREIYYIEKYDTYKNGYNDTLGGQFSKSSKLNQSIADSIKEDIQCTTATFKSIAEKYGVDGSLVSDINTGDIWRNENAEYPLRVSNYGSNKLCKKDVVEIHEMLKNGDTLNAIADAKKVSPTTINNINKGSIHIIDGVKYPISTSVFMPGKLSMDDVAIIVEELKNKDINESYRVFSEKLTNSGKLSNPNGVQRKTLSGINRGELYVEYLEKLGIDKFPIIKV